MVQKSDIKSECMKKTPSAEVDVGIDKYILLLKKEKKGLRDWMVIK